MSRGTEEEVGPTVGFPRNRHFVGFFYVPVQSPTRGQPFNGYFEKPPHFSRLSRRTWGYGGPILVLTPPPSLFYPRAFASVSFVKHRMKSKSFIT